VRSSPVPTIPGCSAIAAQVARHLQTARSTPHHERTPSVRHYGTISTIDVGTGELVVHYAGGHGGRDARLAWSPDGSRLLFQAGDYGRQRIFALTLGTGEVRQLIAGEDPDYYSDFEVASAR
jgi:Tol biopolymer transport system component